MSKEYDQRILDHYKSQAARHGDGASSTMEDERIRALETLFILRFVQISLTEIGPSPPTLYDIGCGNGTSLQAIRSAFPGLGLVGVEFTPELMDIAIGRFKVDDSVAIRQGDLRQPLAGAPLCDLLICQRMLINLLDEADQKRAIGNAIDAVRPGGQLLFIEATTGGVAQLNEARAEFGLAPMPTAHHNRYLEDNTFDSFESIEPTAHPDLPPNFLSTHYFVARVLHPAYLGDRPFSRNSHFVRFFSEALAPAVGNYAPLRAFLFRKL